MPGTSYTATSGGGSYNYSDFFNSDNSVNPNVRNIPIGEYIAEDDDGNLNIIAVTDEDVGEYATKVFFVNIYFPTSEVVVSRLGPQGREGKFTDVEIGDIGYDAELPKLHATIYADGALEIVENHRLALMSTDAFIMNDLIASWRETEASLTAEMMEIRETIRLERAMQWVRAQRAQDDVRNMAIVGTLIAAPVSGAATVKAAAAGGIAVNSWVFVIDSGNSYERRDWWGLYWR